ncbi:MAG: hypothetical protein V4550_15730 [Gemmatimonadota bacterium]
MMQEAGTPAQAVQSTASKTGQVTSAPAGTPSAVYKAFREQRSELKSQLENLEEKRSEIRREMRTEGINAVDKSGLETRIVEIDKRIADVEKQVAVAESNVSQAAGVPGAIVEPPRYVRQGPPEEVFVLGGLFIVVVLLPLTIAYARRIWRRGAAAAIAFPQELADRLSRLDQAVDSIAVEVERIGEGQRFVTRVMSETGKSLGAGAARPLDLSIGEKARIPREGER